MDTEKGKETMPGLMTTAQLLEFLGGISYVKLNDFKKMQDFPQPESKFSTKNFYFYSREKVENWLKQHLD